MRTQERRVALVTGAGQGIGQASALEEDWRSASAKIREPGEVDIVVNNAGHFPNRAIEELDLAT